MSEVKVFKVVGVINKLGFKSRFEKEVRALKPEHAIEKVYMDFGSKHRVKRVNMKILEVKEINPEEAKDLMIRKLSLME